MNHPAEDAARFEEAGLPPFTSSMMVAVVASTGLVVHEQAERGETDGECFSRAIRTVIEEIVPTMLGCGAGWP